MFKRLIRSLLIEDRGRSWQYGAFLAVVTLASVGVPSPAIAQTLDCGVVSIRQILTGPRHGAMMNVSNASCGPGGYVCLDPEGQIMGPEKSKRLFAFVMAASVANRAIQLSVSPSTFAAACNGSYPVVEDVRWP